MTTHRDILVAEHVVKTYEKGRIRALDDLSLTVDRGGFLSIMGPSGSGKSTLLHMLGALDRPDEGRVVLNGRDLKTAKNLSSIRARSIGFVFQLHNLLPTLTALENVELPLRALRTPRRERQRVARSALEGVGLADRRDHRPNALSGGERQRVAVARALVNEPEIVLADEPTGNLDQEAGAKILDLLTGLNRERRLTLVLVTHDPQVASRGGRTICIRDGKVSEE